MHTRLGTTRSGSWLVRARYKSIVPRDREKTHLYHITHVNEGLKKLAVAEMGKLERQQFTEEKRRVAEVGKLERQPVAEEKRRVAEEKTTRETLDKQLHDKTVLPAWQAACTEVDTAWAATKQFRSSRKSPHPPRPKRPLKQT